METLQAASWIEEQEQCAWAAAVSAFLESDSSSALEELCSRGLLRLHNVQEGERVYVLTAEGRAALKAVA